MTDDGEYELVPLPEPVRLRVPGRVVLRDNIFTTVDAIAEDIFAAALNTASSRGVFHLGVSLTPVAEQVFRRLLIDHSMRALPWNVTHVWLTDDAPGQDGEEAPSAGFAEFLRDHAAVPPEQVHAPQLGLADGAAEAYAARMASFLKGGETAGGFDFALLTVNGQGVVGVGEPAEPHTGLTHRVRKGDLAWTSVHAPVFLATSRVGLVVPDADGLSWVKRLPGAPRAERSLHVRPASVDGLTWYVNIESGETDGRPGRGSNRPGKEENRS